jgi:hypothetical protein
VMSLACRPRRAREERTPAPGLLSALMSPSVRVVAPRLLTLAPYLAGRITPAG